MRLFGMDPQVRQIEKEVLKWPNVTSHSHRFGGREFRWGSAEIGHVHDGGVLDIPFPRAIRDALLDEGWAEQHRWVPDSGWTTFRVRKEGGLKHALWLLRLSYLRYALKKSDAPAALFDQESMQLGLSERFRELLAPFVPARAVLQIEPKPAIEEIQRSA